MPAYKVKYVLKSNRQETACTRVVDAANARVACATVKQMVRDETGRNAFHPMAVQVDKEDDNDAR